MDRHSFRAGAGDIAPALPANASVGVLFGASAVGVGLGPTTATAFSLLAMAARAQLAAVELLQEGAALPVVVATIILINLRYATFSAAMAPTVQHLSRRWRAAIAYSLIDITYAVADTRLTDPEAEAVHRGWYFLGISVLWAVTFTGGTFAGTLLGRAVGQRFRLGFIIPLVFIALLASQIDTRRGLWAALAAGGVAVVAAGLPFNLGLLVAGLVGAGVGAAADRAGWAR